MARHEHAVPNRSIFQRRINSRTKSLSTVPTFLKEHEQNTRNVGVKSPPAFPSSVVMARSSSSTYMSWWMPLPPLTPTTPHQTSSTSPDIEKELFFQFPIKSPSPYDGHEENLKTMPGGIDSAPRIKRETVQERNKHQPVVRTRSSPAVVTFLPPIPKGPVCLVAKQESNEDHNSKIADSPSPRTRRENEILEKFFSSLEEQPEDENDYEPNLTPTVAEINFFLNKLAIGLPHKVENNSELCEENENEGKFLYIL